MEAREQGAPVECGGRAEAEVPLLRVALRRDLLINPQLSRPQLEHLWRLWDISNISNVQVQELRCSPGRQIERHTTLIILQVQLD